MLETREFNLNSPCENLNLSVVSRLASRLIQEACRCSSEAISVQKTLYSGYLYEKILYNLPISNSCITNNSTSSFCSLFKSIMLLLQYCFSFSGGGEHKLLRQTKW